MHRASLSKTHVNTCFFKQYFASLDKVGQVNNKVAGVEEREQTHETAASPPSTEKLEQWLSISPDVG
jgi:hypothetical protein